MKTNAELRATVAMEADEIAREVLDGGGVTHLSITRLVTKARLLNCVLLKLQDRAAGRPEPKQGD